MYTCDRELHCGLMNLFDGLQTCFMAEQEIRFPRNELNKKKRVRCPSG